MTAVCLQGKSNVGCHGSSSRLCSRVREGQHKLSAVSAVVKSEVFET